MKFLFPNDFNIYLHDTPARGLFSRSRRAYWTKGETSGHRQWVHSVALDCDGDTLLVRVDQEGPACHTGTRSCFDDSRALAAVVVPVEARPAVVS